MIVRKLRFERGIEAKPDWLAAEGEDELGTESQALSSRAA